MMAPRREMARQEMAYCATHHRLFPHPVVGWLTPHEIAGLALVPAWCDWCTKERGEEMRSYPFTVVSLPVPGGTPRTA